MKQTGTFSRTRIVLIVFGFYSDKSGITGWTETVFLPLSAKAAGVLWQKLKYNYVFFSSLGHLHIWMNLNGKFCKTLNSAFLLVLNMIKYVYSWCPNQDERQMTLLCRSFYGLYFSPWTGCQHSPCFAKFYSYRLEMGFQHFSSLLLVHFQVYSSHTLLLRGWQVYYVEFCLHWIEKTL